ncbi:amidohydrolase family protein [Amycolatopsis mongoliensis]|uniref:Amidohydrolase family protein n=1 Tax=Amycolatopsis mongoliensis TaxID=715475 RepID=A0A9Y2JN06_9PSEU|nr:amidohydrolase family protein [Amycolatopsis sp. 4-36]WIY01616.1 amidohydrolase family protein [Amycolatopsis sp. 4-36]
MPDQPLLVSALQLVDGLGGPPVQDAGVLAGTDGTITWAGPLTEVPALPENCRHITMPGTLLPGFIDTHVHLGLPGGGLNAAMLLIEPPPVRVLKIAAAMRATLEAGVTTVRDLGFLGPSLAKMATTGATPAPRLLNAIAMLSGTGGHGDFPLPHAIDQAELFRVLDLRLAVADGPTEVTKAVRELIRDGAQVIKVAASGGISTPADTPDDIGLTLEELRAAVEAAQGRGRTVAAHAIGTEGIALAVEAGVHSIEHGNGLTPGLADRMARQGTFLVPTLAVMEQTGDPAVMGHHAHAKAGRWREATEKALPTAIGAGVRIATGTDAGLGIRHGQNLSELSLLVQAGLSAMDAIVAGTRTAAEVCSLGDRIGTVEPGKLADLVVVAGDPLADITLLRDPANITLVVQEGRVVKHPESAH